MKKIQKGDEVIVISGRDKGKTGKVLSTHAKNRILVSGVNIIKKHKKPNPGKGETGGIVEQENPFQISNVGILNNETGKSDRVGFLFSEEGKKYRVFKSTGKRIDI